MEKENELPEGWSWNKLGSICEVVTGTTPPKSDSTNYGTYMPFFKPPHLWDREIVESDEMLSHKGSKKGRIVPPNTVLVTCIGNLGRTGFVKKDSSFNQQINAIVENSSIIGKYIFYQAQSPLFKKQLEKLATGTTVSIVNKTNFETIEIPLPPLSTQHLIVTKIEELFSAIDKGIEDLKRAQQQLKVYRQSVLKWAFEGKLTNKNVKEGELPKGWEISELGKLIEMRLGKMLDKNKNKGNLQFYLRNISVRWGNFDLENLSQMRFEESEVEKYLLRKGDLIICEGGEPGRCAIWKDELPNMKIQKALHRVRVNENLSVNFLYHYLFFLSKNGTLETYFTGTTIKHLTGEGLKKIKMSYPPIEEQQQIVQEIENRLSVADKLEETITQSLQQAEALKQSVLKKAFEGKLLSSNEIMNEKNKVRNIIQVIEPKIHSLKVEFPLKKENISTTDLHAGILSMVIDAHESNLKYIDKLNHVKGEKIAHLVEYKIGIFLGREPVKDAAGPDDYNHLKKVEHRANMANWFGIKKLPIGHTYQSKHSIQAIIEKTKNVLSSDENTEVTELIKTFLKFDMEQAEVIATVYAGWNNLLLNGFEPTDEEIVFESRENWSERKLTIEREKFFKTLEWMKRNSYIPVGRGQLVLKNEIKSKKKSK